MKEIGGFFGIELLEGKPYYKNFVDINYARNCLEVIISKRNIKKIYLPYYLCNSVKEKCVELKCEIKFYHINAQFLPIIEEIVEEAYVYIVNYYGLLDNCKINELKSIYKNIIIDNAQSFFQNSVKGIDTIYSCRKFFGVPDGAYLSTDLQEININEREKVISNVEYMIGRYEKSANEYYLDFRKSEENIKNRGLKRMSLFSKNILNAINYDIVKKIRNENFRYLNFRLKQFNKIELDEEIEGPYMYPLLIENSERLRNKLIKNKIYIPILWPGIEKNLLNKVEEMYIYDLLPIPIDQRYDLKDMDYIVNLIMEECKCIS